MYYHPKPFMLQSKIQDPIPERLSHHTNLNACKSILSGPNAKGICFWVISNQCKNDNQEIKMGKYMHERIKEVAFKHSLLRQFNGYESSASLSFMEGESTTGMIEKYGNIRLEFDLRKHVSLGALTGGFMNCEYVAEDEIVEYADEYCALLKHQQDSIPKLQEKYGVHSPFAFNAMADFLMMEADIMYKVFTIKEKKWSEEKEWRQVLQLREGDTDVKLTPDGRPYKEFFLPKEALTGVTILYQQEPFRYMDVKHELEPFLKEKGYNVPLKTQLIR